MKNNKLTNPYDLVSEALECTKESLNEESCMVNHPKWDSLTHICIINDIESKYKITIPDEDVMKYDTMKAIVDLYDKLTQDNEHAV